MQVQKNTVVGIHYTISVDNEGEVFSNLDYDPEEYVHGAISIFPAVAKALEGHQINDTVQVTVSPQYAYGAINEKLFQSFPISLFDNINSLEIGTYIQIPGGNEAKLLQKNQDSILVDANHPLAGAELHYNIKIASIRPATELEIQRGLSESVIKSCDGSPNCC
jgi:FKBP-type peptidyl-prolyl cis-trans isomerase SlyD